jgi:hypothetical protein
MDGTVSARMSSLRTPYSPTKSSWPTSSSSDFGRIRSARGMASSVAFRFTFFVGWRPFEGSDGRVSTPGRSVVGDEGCGAALFFGAFEKKPDPREGYNSGEGIIV